MLHVDNTKDSGSFGIQVHIFLIDQYFLNHHDHHYHKIEPDHLNFHSVSNNQIASFDILPLVAKNAKSTLFVCDLSPPVFLNISNQTFVQVEVIQMS